MAERFVEYDWVFIYTREAHPGENVPYHQSMDEKLDRARMLRDEIGVRRTILVDDLLGTVHQAYGLLPNMTWVISRTGRILYKAAWTSAAAVESFILRFESSRGRKPPSGTVSPFATEQIEYRDVDRDAFYRHLRRNGSRSYEEFKRAEEIWKSRRP